MPACAVNTWKGLILNKMNRIDISSLKPGQASIFPKAFFKIHGEIFKYNLYS